MYKDIISDENNTKGGKTECYRSTVCMLLQLSWHQSELDCYKFRITVILMITTKKTTKNTGNEMRIKTVHSKNQLNTQKRQ